MTSKRNELLNIAEAIAAFLVVCIHFPVPGNGEITAIGSISVPLFFSISGYFFYKGNSDAEHRSIPRKLKNLLFLILISELTYFSFYTLLHMRHVGFGIQAVINTIEAEVLNYYCKELTARLIVFAPPFNGIGWFIGSLIMVYLVILSVVRRKWFPIFLICTLALLLVGVLIRRIFIMMDLKTLLPDERILPLLPLPFFAMGYLMHRHQEQCLSVGDRFCLVVFAAGTVLTLAENCFQTHTLYIGTVLMVPSILLLCVKHGEHVPQSWFGRMMSHIGSKTATYIYLFHILVETVLRVMINGVLPGIRENSLFATAYPLIVFAASAVFGEMIFRVKLLGKHLNTKT
jgi:surface polysaccharide O-acyltransferase-like enzyme